MPLLGELFSKPQISLGQFVGLIGAMFMGFEFYYNSDKTTKDFANHKQDVVEHRKQEDLTNDELKSLTYRLVGEAKEEMNGRLNRKVNPLEEKVDDVVIWKSYQEGLEAGRAGK
jgi:hypothetical protein